MGLANITEYIIYFVLVAPLCTLEQTPRQFGLKLDGKEISILNDVRENLESVSDLDFPGIDQQDIARPLGPD